MNHRSLPLDAPASSFSSSPNMLFSPSSQTHLCQERLFPEDSSEEAFAEEDDVGGVDYLLSASMTGSIHELQEEAGSALTDPSSMTASLASCHLDEKEISPASTVKDHESDEDDQFEDAKEELSPERRVAQATEAEGGQAQATSTPSPARSISREGVTASASWRERKKHLFILSDAGKPIFSLHGDEDELAALTAVMQAMVSYVVDMSDSLRSFNVDGGLIVFLNKSPLILVAVSRGMESVTQLIVQLTYLYNQLLSVLTLSSLTRIFEQRKGFDLRRMIAGSERLLESLSRAMDTDPCFMLSAVRVLPLQPQAREAISSSISQACGKVKNVVFAILIADNQLVTLVRMKKYFIHPADLHLIFNLVNSTESFKMSETWTPICLPKFDSSGFMHAHVSYLSDSSPACLIMLSIDKDSFFELSEAKTRIVASLEKSNSLQAISDGRDKSAYTSESIGIQIRHFLYKAKTAAQFTCPKLSHPYGDEESRYRLHGIYLQIQNRLHSMGRPLKLFYYGGHHENVLGWVTQSFELYASFAPSTPKAAAIEAINRLLKWCKREENTLFILNAPTF